MGNVGAKPLHEFKIAIPPTTKEEDKLIFSLFGGGLGVKVCFHSHNSIYLPILFNTLEVKRHI